MKNLLCFALLLFSAQSSYAQTKVLASTSSTSIERKDDTLILELTEAPEAAWRRLAQVLMQRGYSIERSDKDLLTLATFPLVISGYPIRVTSMVLDGRILVRMYTTVDSAPGRELAERIRRRGSDNWEWRELEAIGRDFGGPVRYAVSRAD